MGFALPRQVSWSGGNMAFQTTSNCFGVICLPLYSIGNLVRALTLALSWLRAAAEKSFQNAANPSAGGADAAPAGVATSKQVKSRIARFISSPGMPQSSATTAKLDGFPIHWNQEALWRFIRPRIS